MQHEKKHSFKETIRDRGYYIVLGLCVAAVGVSGYLFSRSVKPAVPKTSPIQEILSAAPSVTVPKLTEAEEKTGKVVEKVQEVLGTAEPQETEKPAPKQSVPKQLTQTAAPVEGEIVQVYSMESLAYNPTTKDWRTHDGVDFLAPLGAEVYAAADGTVEAVFCDDFFGQTVTVRHTGGYVTRYANLAEEVLVAVGQSVHAGDPLGRIGQTALLEVSQEPHLHFSVTCQDRSVDPVAFLSKS